MNKDLVSLIKECKRITEQAQTNEQSVSDEEDTDGEEEEETVAEENEDPREEIQETSVVEQDIINHNILALTEVEKLYLEQNKDIIIIRSINCAAHTLQLVVKEGIRMCNESANVIIKVRHIVTKLRTQNYLNLIKRRGLKHPILDNEIRWNYTYLMVSTPFFFKLELKLTLFKF